LAIGFIAALWLAARLAAADGLQKNKVYDLGLYVLASGLLGSKLLMIIIEWNEIGWRRVFSLDILQSGGVYFGGFLTALAVSLLLVRIWRLPWLRTADAFAAPVALGHALGRLGCFSAGCCWGKPTDSWIGVRFTERANEITGVPIHSDLVPTQLIEMAANLLIFGLLLLLRKRRSFDGQVMFAYLILYSVARFTIEFWRDDPRGSLFGLSTSQFISILLFPLGLGLALYCWRRSQSRSIPHDEPVAAQPSQI
jgi:phosphatidylglycerol:prolipoprotein diacylglycerol transferase